jgi:hypothetical protein
MQKWWQGYKTPWYASMYTDSFWDCIGTGIYMRGMELGSPVYQMDYEAVAPRGIAHLISVLEQHGGKLAARRSVYEGGDFNRVCVVWDSGALTMWGRRSERRISGALTFHNFELFSEIKEVFQKEIAPAQEKGVVFILGSKSGTVSPIPIGEGSVPIERLNYSEDVLEAYDHVIEDMNNESPCGRMILLSGLPGSGKSYLVRAMMADCTDAMFITVPPDMVQSLGQPQLMSTLIQNKHRRDKAGSVVLVLEDADQCLIPRGMDNMGVISNLLNFSDGLLGELLNLRIIATTNAKKIELDEALQRPGRICRSILVDKLKPDHAAMVFERLTGTKRDYSNAARTLASVYRDARDSGWVPPVKDKRTSDPDDQYFYDDYLDY